MFGEALVSDQLLLSKPSLKLAIPGNRPQETRGFFSTKFYSRAGEIKNRKLLEDTIESLSNLEIKDFAFRLFNLLVFEIEKQKGYTVDCPLSGALADDGSFLMEFITSNFRVGFSVEEDKANSSWYIVSKESAGEINAYGYLHGVNLQTLVKWLVSFISYRVLE